MSSTPCARTSRNAKPDTVPYTVTILGSGTSTGVPQIGCSCEVCTSADPRDKRLRASAIISTPRDNNFIIDIGPDFRQQILRQGSPRLDAALFTHSHYDHVAGLDDLRPYCKDGSFPIWCEPGVYRYIRQIVPYSFAEHLYPGVPTFVPHEIESLEPFDIGGDTIVPLRIFHGKLPILGYRIGPVAYITDCSCMPPETIERLRGVDTLVINALRQQPHPSHMSLPEALDIIAQIQPRQTYLTHLSHHMGLHAVVSRTLPDNVAIAYDGLSVKAGI